MSQWHYRVEQYTLSRLEDRDYLDALGEEGWELVYFDRLSRTQTGTQVKWLAVFKKQLIQYGKP
jgi:hypothetical protein